jgi:outer membrane protein assembly factor BamB
MKRMFLMLGAASLLGGCGIFGNRPDPSTPTIGQRVSVLSGETNVQVDATLAGVAVALPAPVANTEWTQSGGNAPKAMGHLALGETIAPAWSVQIGEGSSRQARLGAEPIFADGRVYVMDTRAVVTALNPDNGSVLWRTQVRGPQSSEETLFGGGVSFDNGRLYATNGSGYAVALDPATGGQYWEVRPGGPLRGAPTIGNENVYVVSQDNQLFALNPQNGQNRWSGSGTVELAGVFGTAAPAAAQGTVVAGFSSGELTAYRYENGRVVWQDALARTGVTTQVGALSDIDADPVIHEGRVYAIGQGGRMVALELTTGQRLWEINVAGISTPAVSGEWIFVVTDEAQLLAVARASGRIRWMAQLPRWRDPEDRQGPIHWRGPVLAGNRLILTNSEGQIAQVSPADGTVLSAIDTRVPISLAPVVANNTLYILDDSGRLTAYR